MKKFFCLIVMMVSCFGFIGFVDADTITYDKVVDNDKSITLGGNYVESSKDVSKTLAEFVTGDFYYTKTKPVADKDKFKLVGSEKKAKTDITANPESILKYYTLVSTDSTATSATLYYVDSYNKTDGKYSLKEITSVLATTAKAGTSYKFDTKTGKYTLVDTKDVEFASLKDKFICKGGVDTTCQYMYQIVSVDATALTAKANLYYYKTIITTVSSSSTSKTNTSTKNGTVQTKTNPNTGIADYIIYLVPVALVVGTGIVMKRKHA